MATLCQSLDQLDAALVEPEHVAQARVGLVVTVLEIQPCSSGQLRCSRIRRSTKVRSACPRRLRRAPQSSHDSSLSWRYTLLLPALRLPELVAGEQHRRAVAEEQRHQQAAADAAGARR